MFWYLFPLTEIVESGILEVGVHVTTFEVDGLDGAQSSGKSAAPEKPKEQSGSLKLKLQKKKVVEEVPSSPPEPTEYSKNRPRRQLIGSRATMGDTTESTDLTTLQEFIGPVGSEGGRCQPFEVTLSSDAVLVMDFHAHLSTWEVIGLLGGQFDEETKQLTIKSAYPCRRAAGSDSGTSVELDPASQVEVTAEMSKEGLKPVGWYHSHPVFEARPSAKDNENQRNYQALCRDGKHEPWVGIIIGPYDQQLATPVCVSMHKFD
jgi:protein MYSM1